MDNDNGPLNLKIKAKKPREEETYELLKKAIIKGICFPDVRVRKG